MSAIHRVLRCLVPLALALASWALPAKEAAAPEAALTIANRHIATLRMTALGGTPELRIRR
ncbi:MAG: hypothetical protein JNK80_11190, partial [Dechloromonas sp.]|nr:hypothetical protein [Dechloromonas sp.]